MKLEKVSIETLIPDPANIRKHDEKNIQSIMGSLARFGQQKNIVVDKNNIVRAGNGTIEAAKRLGWKEIQIFRTELEGAELIAFCIADNRTTDLSEFDVEGLKLQLDSLQADGINLDEIGFDMDDLDALFGKEEPEPEEKEVELPEQKFEVLITLKNEMEQKFIFDELTERKISCVIL